MESWVGVAIFFAIAFVLFVFVIARTVYRAYSYHDCCRSCRKMGQTGDPRNKQTHSIAAELQAVNAKQRASLEQEASVSVLRRNSSQTFDPLKPDSLELPTHGTHLAEPGKEEVPTGGHNEDFFIANVGYDEPDKETPYSNEEDRIKGNVPGPEVPIQESHSKGDVAAIQESGEYHNGNVPSPKVPVLQSDSRQDFTPSQEPGKYQDLIIEGPVPANDYAALVKKEEPEVETGIQNPVDVEDSY